MMLRSRVLMYGLTVLLAACSVLHPQTPKTALPLPTNASELMEYTEPKTCQSPPVSGLPVSDSLKNSHILYQAGQSIDILNQVRVYSIKDSSHKLVLGNLSYPYYQPVFLLDGFHFVLVEKGSILLSDLDSSSPIFIDHKSNKWQSLIDDIPRYSRTWRILNGVGNEYSPTEDKSAIWNPGDPYLVILDHQTDKKVNVLKYDNNGYIAGNWSPDGGLFAFTYSKALKDELSSVYVVNADGTGLKVLAQYTGTDLGRPYWSPNGQVIAFTSHKNLNLRPTTYIILSLATGETKKFITNTEESLASRNGNDIVWSPDNQWFLFFTQEYEGDYWKYDIETLNISTGELYCITNDNLVETSADWR